MLLLANSENLLQTTEHQAEVCVFSGTTTYITLSRVGVSQVAAQHQVTLTVSGTFYLVTTVLQAFIHMMLLHC